MADVGKSQARQVGNLKNTPAGATGYAVESRGGAYFKFGSTPDAGNRPSRDLNLDEVNLTPAGPGSYITSAAGVHYYDFSTYLDAGYRLGRSAGLFGGTGGIDSDTGSSGATQGDAGTLPIPENTVIFYSMRRTDTGAVGGYAHWVNTTGDATGAPAAIGTVGQPVIIATWVE